MCTTIQMTFNDYTAKYKLNLLKLTTIAISDQGVTMATHCYVNG